MKKLLVILISFIAISLKAQTYTVQQIDYRNGPDTTYLLMVELSIDGTDTSKVIIFEPIMLDPYVHLFTAVRPPYTWAYLGNYTLEDLIAIIKQEDIKGSIYSNDYVFPY